MQGDFRLGDWHVQPSLGRASRDGQTIHVRAKVMDLLVCLADRAGEVVSKDEILTVVWKTEFVTESALTRVVADLRQAFGDDRDHPTVLETIPKRGYRLLPPVIRQSAAPESGDETAAASTTTAVGERSLWSTFWTVLVGVALAAGAAWVVMREPTHPVLTDRDTVLLADFENRTGDPSFDDVLRNALAIHLAQSPFLYFVPDTSIRESLQLMRHDAEAPLHGSVARAVCEREGAKVLIAGSVSRLGERYAVSLEGVGCLTGESVGRTLEEAAGKEQVLGALSAAASTLRRKLGESLASIQRFDLPLPRITTSSLDALKAHRLAGRELTRGAGHEAEAIRLYQHAIALDPEFASAYQGLGVVHSNLGHGPQANENIRRAWELRDRVSEREKLLIESFLSWFVLGDVERTVETYRLLLRLYPRDRGPNNNLTLIYQELGLYEQALEAARENFDFVRNRNALAFLQLGRASMCLGQFDEAQRVFEEARTNGLENVDMLVELYEIAFHRRDAAAMDQYVARAAGSPLEVRMWATRAQGLAALGQWQRSSELSDRITRSTDGPQDPVAAALRAALVGTSRGTTTRKLKALLRKFGDQMPLGVASVAAVALALAGDHVEASRVRDMVMAGAPAQSTIMRKRSGPTVAAAIAISEHKFREAIALLDQMGHYELGRPIRGLWRHAVYLPIYLRAQAYLAAGQPREAAGEFQKILDRPGLGLTSLILPLSRLGLARAFASAGNIAASRKAYEDVLAVWQNADRDFPPAVEARLEYAALMATP